MTHSNSYQVKVNGEWLPVSCRVKAMFASTQLKNLGQDGNLRAFTNGKFNHSLTKRVNSVASSLAL